MASRDYRDYLALRSSHTGPIERTTPQPGDRIITSHRAYRVREDGGWDPIGGDPLLPAAPVNVTPWAILSQDLAGTASHLLIGAVFAIVFLALFLIGG